jgi:Fe2+ or Zn2+ uptake regulation protein
MNSISPATLSEEWLTKLKNNGYRLTDARKAVVETIAVTTHALTPVEVFDQARESCPGMGLVTVYRTLEKLEELGLIQRVHQEQGCQAFLRAGVGHQHLLICERCGRAVLFDGDNLEKLFTQITQKTGFIIKDHWLQVSGICAKCQ